MMKVYNSVIINAKLNFYQRTFERKKVCLCILFIYISNEVMTFLGFIKAIARTFKTSYRFTESF